MQFMKTAREIAEYGGRTYKHGGDVKLAVKSLSVPVHFTMPPDPPHNASRGEEKVWEKLIDEHMKRMILFCHMMSLYSLIWGQCSDIM